MLAEQGPQAQQTHARYGILARVLRELGDLVDGVGQAMGHLRQQGHGLVHRVRKRHALAWGHDGAKLAVGHGQLAFAQGAAGQLQQRVTRGPVEPGPDQRRRSLHAELLVEPEMAHFHVACRRAGGAQGDACIDAADQGHQPQPAVLVPEHLQLVLQRERGACQLLGDSIERGVSGLQRRRGEAALSATPLLVLSDCHQGQEAHGGDEKHCKQFHWD